MTASRPGIEFTGGLVGAGLLLVVVLAAPLTSAPATAAADPGAVSALGANSTFSQAARYVQESPDVDWASVLATADPHLSTDGPCPRPLIPDSSICVFVNTADQAWLTRVFGIPENTPAADGKPFFMGWAMLDQVTYGDIANDGQTNAVVEVDSGGTAGIAGFFVYRLGDSTPRLLDGREGFALEAYIDPDAHVLYELGAFSRPCCATGIVRTSYTLVGDNLVTQGSCKYFPTPADLHIPRGECVPLATGSQRTQS